MKKKQEKPSKAMSHTPEPWKAHQTGRIRADMLNAIITKFVNPSEYEVFDNNGNVVAVVRQGEHAARIVACVNACAGIPTEKLEGSSLKELLKVIRGVYDGTIRLDTFEGK